jgi:hypothetical protein
MITVRVYGAQNARRYFSRLSRDVRSASTRAKLNIARSVQQKARYIVDRETIAHTGLLREDIRIVPVGRGYKVIAGEYAPHAYWIEYGRRAVMGYRFVPTQAFPLEGYAVPAPQSFIKEAKGIHYMERAADHARMRAGEIIERENAKVIK